MVNFVCIIFEQGVKMFTLSSMGNLIVECNLKKKSRDHLKGYKLTHCAHCAKNVQNQKISSGVGGGGGGGQVLTSLLVTNIWASTRQNLSSGFLKKRGSNQSPQLYRPAGNVKFRS